MNEKKTWVYVGLVTFILVTYPIFFSIYRENAFNTTPHDPYAEYLLYLIGQDNYGEPMAPFAYRIISVIVAIPFYYILPTYAFTNLSNIDITYLRAIEALSFVSYVSIVLTAVIIYTISRKQFLATKASSLIAGILTFFLSNFISRIGVDPFAILITSLLLLWLKNPLVFVPLVLVSMGINEKILIIFATILIFRFVISIKQRRQFTLYVQLCSSCVAIVGYFAIKIFFKVPGHEDQTNPALILEHLQSSLIHTLSLHGLFQNGLPILILSLLAAFAIKSRQQNSSFHISDVSGLFVLLIIAMIADIVHDVGRVVMYSYPLYLPAVAYFIDKVLKEDG